MNDFQYLQLKEMIKNNEFRKSFHWNLTGVIFSSIGGSMMLLVLTSFFPITKGVLKNELMVTWLTVSGISLLAIGFVIIFFFNIELEVKKDEQLEELDKIKKWCEKHPDKAKDLDFSASPEIYKEFFQFELE